MIAYLLGSLNRGGAETLLLDVLNHAKSNGLEAVCAYRKSGVLEHQFQQTGISIQKISFKNFIAGIFNLRKFLKNHQVKVAHAHQPLDALILRILSFIYPLKVVFTMHGYDYSESLVSGMILKYILKRTDLNLYVSNTQMEYFQKKYHLTESKQKVVYNGISFEKLRNINTSDSLSIREEFRVEKDALLLGMVGNFLPVRDQMTVCKFLKLLNDRSIKFSFIFAGSKSDVFPSLYDECVEFIRENKLEKQVHFAGSRTDIPVILSALDAFVYSTVYDTFGIAVVEALASGVPVFVNDWKVMQEVTENGNLAIVYKSSNPEDLLEKFLIFYNNIEVMKMKSGEIQRLIKNRYSIENHLISLKKIYRLFDV
jgi:glycosyltransferase involved in cell wall biosynthesis